MSATNDWDARASAKVDNILDTEPEALRRPVPKPQPYPVQALGPVLAGAVEAICSTIQCPPAVAAGSALLMGSLSVQGLANVRQDMLNPPASLFLLTVAQSGERKSASDKAALTPLGDWLKTARKNHRSLAEKHAAELKEHAARVAAVDKRCKDGEGLADALLGVGQAPPAPRSPARTIADTTQEGIFKALLHGHQSQALTSAEAGIVTSGHSMKPEAVARWIGSLSLLWDGAPLDRIRQDGGRQDLYGRRLCSHLLMQPVIAEQLLGDRQMVDQGILARFLIAWPESTVGTRTYVPRSPLADSRMQRYCERLTELLALPLPIDDEDELQPLTPSTPLTPPARLVASLVAGCNAKKPGRLQAGYRQKLPTVTAKSPPVSTKRKPTMTDPAELPAIDHEAVAAFLAEPLPPMPEPPAVDWLEAEAARLAEEVPLLRAE